MLMPEASAALDNINGAFENPIQQFVTHIPVHEGVLYLTGLMVHETRPETVAIYTYEREEKRERVQAIYLLPEAVNTIRHGLFFHEESVGSDDERYETLYLEFSRSTAGLSPQFDLKFFGFGNDESAVVHTPGPKVMDSAVEHLDKVMARKIIALFQKPDKLI